MKIFLNAEPCELNARALDLALMELGFDSHAIATAVNGNFVAAVDRTNTVLTENDRLEVLAPMQGG